ncbi:MAG: TatD family hydrolase [Burkholderiaceae bacterium]|jgi:TatD DNase family protein|nr:TatD family hydrolase [Burkholderiaceae bacterium]
MFTDSHCHLTFAELASDLSAVLAAMQAARVTRALCISTSMEEFGRVQALAAAHGNLWATAGVHPDNEGGREPSVQELVQACAQSKVVAIGETGLDYYMMQQRKGGRSIAELEWQRERFRAHIRAARLARVPLVIHMRAACEDTLAILREEGEDGSPGSVGGVFHCFTETPTVARAALALGFHISLSGIVTFKNAADVHEVARLVPEERLLIETDSPYLAPVPYRGKVNSPAYVPYVAARIAELRGVPIERVAEFTGVNFTRLFLRGVTHEDVQGDVE